MEAETLTTTAVQEAAEAPEVTVVQAEAIVLEAIVILQAEVPVATAVQETVVRAVVETPEIIAVPAETAIRKATVREAAEAARIAITPAVTVIPTTVQPAVPVQAQAIVRQIKMNPRMMPGQMIIRRLNHQIRKIQHLINLKKTRLY